VLALGTKEKRGLTATEDVTNKPPSLAEEGG